MAPSETQQNQYSPIYGIAFEDSPIGMAIADTAGNCLNVNQALCQMIGANKDQILAQNFYNLPSWKESGLLEKATEAIRTDSATQLLVPFTSSFGKTIFVNTHFLPLKVAEKNYLLLTMDDLTEQKKIENARKQAEEKFYHSKDLLDYVISHARSAIAVHDKELNYIYVSDRYLKDYNVQDKNVIGKHHYDVFPDLPQKWRDVHQRCLKGEVLSAEEDPYYRDDGSVEWTRWECRPWFEADGSIGGIIVYTEVITDRKNQEQEKHKLQEQLFQSQKMETVGRLAGGVAHDFNNMLGAIIGHTQLAMMKMDRNSAVHPHLNEILKAAQRSSGLTKQLLAFARQQPSATQVLDLNKTIDKTLNMLTRLIGEDIHIQWGPKDKTWPIKMDLTQIDQILVNLIVNSRDAISGSGTIYIDTENVHLDTNAFKENPAFHPGDFVQLTIRDTGCGMDQETLEHLFEPFFTTKEVGKGTGLGLAMVDGIVQQNKGFINVESKVNEGCTFKIYFPRCRDAHREDLVESEALPRGNGELILIVEDEPSILKLTTAMLENLGYKVLTADSPDKALNLAKNYANKINLLLTDVVMPKMNGRELADHMMNISPNLRCIFMSGYTAHIISNHGVSDSGIFFLQKPFTLHHLATKVAHVLNKI